MTRSHLLWLLALSAPALGLGADGWPQYNGTASNRSAAAELGTPGFPEAGPRVAWRVPMNGGFSSFAVVGDRAYTIDRRRVDGEWREVCVALDAGSGEEVWQQPLAPSEYDGGAGAGARGNDGGDGPRSTPSAVDGRVHVYDARMVLRTFDAGTGEPLWKVDVVQEHAGKNIQWQNAASPLVDGGRVFVAGGGAGQSLLAFDAASGKLAWAFGAEAMTHATPVAAELHGKRQVLFFVQSGLVAADPETGEELWRQAFPYRTSSAASPVVHGDTVFLSAGYGVGGGVVKVTKSEGGFAAELAWHQRNKLMNHWSTPVCRDGYLYGMFGFKKYGKGPLECVELATGEVKWSKEGFGPGNVILVGEHLVALGDAGQVVIVAADPAGYGEVARADVLEGKCWSSPAFADGKIYVRSTAEAVCLDVR